MRALLFIALLFAGVCHADEYLGRFGGSPYAGQSFQNNPINRYGEKRLYNQKGEFRGNLNSNPYDPNSINNPYGRYGSRYSPDSINNPYGAGSRYNPDSPANPYGQGWSVYGD